MTACPVHMTALRSICSGNVWPWCLDEPSSRTLCFVVNSSTVLICSSSYLAFFLSLWLSLHVTLTLYLPVPCCLTQADGWGRERWKVCPSFRLLLWTLLDTGKGKERVKKNKNSVIIAVHGDWGCQSFFCVSWKSNKKRIQFWNSAWVSMWWQNFLFWAS